MTWWLFLSYHYWNIKSINKIAKSKKFSLGPRRKRVRDLFMQGVEKRNNGESPAVAALKG
jgi:hypothetical protein